MILIQAMAPSEIFPEHFYRIRRISQLKTTVNFCLKVERWRRLGPPKNFHVRQIYFAAGMLYL
jgi:hypothetical protein